MKNLTIDKRIHFNGVLCRDLYGSYGVATGELMLIHDLAGNVHWINGGSLAWPESCPIAAAHIEG